VKSWQLRYTLNGKGQTATLGKLDRLSLEEARTRRDELLKVVERGEHLTLHKRTERVKRRADAANTFHAFVHGFTGERGKRVPGWIDREARRAGWSSGHKDEVAASIENHLAELDDFPLSKITAPLVAPLLRAVEDVPHMYVRVRRRLRAILDDAVESGAIAGNPLPMPRRRKSAGADRHYPAITDPTALGNVLRAAAAATDSSKAVQRAHVVIAFTAQRVSEVVGAPWAEFALDTGDWSIPRERMKIKDPARGPHVVPLPPALLAQLREWRREDGNGATFVCPTPTDPERSITPEAVEKFYRVTLKLAGRHKPHSWRTSFSTICREAGKDGDVVEAQLDHIVGKAVASAYDRAKRLTLRRELMIWYEQRLLAARDGEKPETATVHALEERRSAKK
jgi:integrase